VARRPSNIRFAISMTLLACACVGGSLLGTSYFAAPAWFRARTEPVVQTINAAAEFFNQTADRIRGEVERLQAADAPPAEDAVPFGPPPATEFLMSDGREILTGGSMDITYFNQSEEPWNSGAYGSDDIGKYGCGPTVMAMAVSSLTDQYSNPVEMAQWAYENDHWASRGGSYTTLIQDAASAFGLQGESLPDLSADTLRQALQSGKLVVALMGPGDFTESGHFILLHGVIPGGKILVADSNSRERSLMAWDPQVVIDQLSPNRRDGAPLWAISKPSA
jgi:hypothetical protein